MNLDDLYPAVLALLMVGILLGIGIFTMASIRESVATTQTSGGIGHGDVGINVSDARATNTTTLTDASKDNYKLLTINVTNYTGNYQLTENVTGWGNYTYTDAGVVSWLGLLTAYDAYFINITTTYTYDEADSPESAIQDVLEGTGDFADWIAIIVVVLAAAIILGIVLRSFGAKEVGV